MSRLQVYGVVRGYGPQVGLYIDNGGNVDVLGVISGHGPANQLSVSGSSAKVYGNVLGLGAPAQLWVESTEI